MPLAASMLIPEQEFQGVLPGDLRPIRHRLIAADGRVTQWATYSGYTFLDGYVGYTAYYCAKEGVSTAEDFCRETGVC